MQKVEFLLFPGFQMLAYVLATETLRLANKCAGEPLFEWETLTATQAPVRASNGALVAPDRTGWRTGSAPELVLLCAGYDPLQNVPASVKAWLARMDRSGATLGGVDTGTVVLAALGFLDGHEAVLHYEAEPGFRETWPDIAVSDRIYCHGRRRLTAAGGIATSDAMLAWIASTASAALAAATSDAMAHGEIRPPAAGQRAETTADPVLQQMHRMMAASLQDPRPLQEIADSLRLSLKALRLRCQRGLGMAPKAYYLQLRLSYARDLLRNTEMPVTEVGLAAGFASPASFSRLFKSRYQHSPRALRRR
ncbi:GlxA family transcriptional regulator [Leisingera sp. ANG-Vp]|uniref:GlxA family transcriptional regulator n=1 Tax=Leisingera sp. ANG-Vp TaxID=1577896 RepID=UPI00058063F2|nr:helix-turn-helix domain-containing protein [Leisingera sp. ANG-Vp]KIC14259.1 AraC family transcriptional regulator [Leisingera sp. ANG-Vp]